MSYKSNPNSHALKEGPNLLHTYIQLVTNNLRIFKGTYYEILASETADDELKAKAASIRFKLLHHEACVLASVLTFLAQYSHADLYRRLHIEFSSMP